MSQICVELLGLPKPDDGRDSLDGAVQCAEPMSLVLEILTIKVLSYNPACIFSTFTVG